MNSWKVIVATIVIFGAGVFTGGFLVNSVQHTPPAHRQMPLRKLEELAPQPEILKTNFVQRLDFALNLSPQQRKQIEKIIADAQKRNSDLWKIVAPQMRDVIQDAHQQIREVLTPQQKKKFEGLVRRAHRPIPATNTPTNAPDAKIDFKTRLERIHASTTNFSSAFSNLTPDEQAIVIKAEQTERMHALTNASAH